jgi:hypothetical protein
MDHEISGFSVKNRKIRTFLKYQEKIKKVVPLRSLILLKKQQLGSYLS